MQSYLRRCQDMLSAGGKGVIFFGIWNVIKVIMYFVMARDTMSATFKRVDAEGLEWIVILIMAVMIGISLAFRVFVGRSAIKESRETKKKYAYIIIAFIMLAASAASIILNFQNLLALRILSFIVEELVEVTSFVTILEVIIYGIKIKKVRQQIAQGEE